MGVDVAGVAIKVIREGRSERLKRREQVFSGLFWSGEDVLALGLVDGISDRRPVLGEVLAIEKGVDCTPPPDRLGWWDG